MKSTLVVLALSLAFASAALAQALPAEASVPALGNLEITIGTAVPSGKSFVITLDERIIDRAYPVWTWQPLSGAWTPIVTKEQFRSLVRDVVQRKLAATFPDGFPPDAYREDMEMKIKLSNPPEISINFGC